MAKGFLCLIVLSVVLQVSFQSKLCKLPFEQEVLNAHNYYRAMHNAPALSLNPMLSQLATNWAHTLVAKNRREHSQNGYGENIYWAYMTNQDGKDAVRAWYEEISLYNWNHPSFSTQTGHFTQVVWKGSTELGVGFAKSGNAIFVVCNYNPPGNHKNEFGKNVAHPTYYR
ncbi:Golgi-associated plant pathogenesis-related protein 1-like [Drosophila biarmipes]|uniref:Golgi-associated plant pathogenesis-related protein 1-like n=1 Tax=Drosophila biarmipes TaxID=125945 RepID=UPI0021CCB6B7|nr:Golgi-associated plant pathogenesis-related protein 1-like [Drosophila biarmipes]